MCEVLQQGHRRVGRSWLIHRQEVRKLKDSDLKLVNDAIVNGEDNWGNSTESVSQERRKNVKHEIEKRKKSSKSPSLEEQIRSLEEKGEASYDPDSKYARLVKRYEASPERVAQRCESIMENDTLPSRTQERECTKQLGTIFTDWLKTRSKQARKVASDSPQPSSLATERSERSQSSTPVPRDEDQVIRDMIKDDNVTQEDFLAEFPKLLTIWRMQRESFEFFNDAHLSLMNNHHEWFVRPERVQMLQNEIHRRRLEKRMTEGKRGYTTLGFDNTLQTRMTTSSDGRTGTTQIGFNNNCELYEMNK